ncbi:MAG: hypothetical protein H0W21_06060 [Actinobacteria bacterium]|nr:hypothetical protein [Actinomycetota bacterium]
MKSVIDAAEKRNEWSANDEAEYTCLNEEMTVIDGHLDDIESNAARVAQLNEARKRSRTFPSDPDSHVQGRELEDCPVWPLKKVIRP